MVDHIYIIIIIILPDLDIFIYAYELFATAGSSRIKHWRFWIPRD
jgi:hypothetical protein